MWIDTKPLLDYKRPWIVYNWNIMYTCRRMCINTSLSSGCKKISSS